MKVDEPAIVTLSGALAESKGGAVVTLNAVKCLNSDH